VWNRRFIGPRDATPIILNGLKRLEYRGYDSAGLAVLSDGKIEVRRDAGKLSRLVELVDNSPISGSPELVIPAGPRTARLQHANALPTSAPTDASWSFIMALSRIFSNCVMS